VLTAATANDFYMRMKPTAMIQLKSDTVERAIQTINNRNHAIGVTEPSVQKYGASATNTRFWSNCPVWTIRWK